MQQNPRTYDEAKLASMTEPLSVRVERIKGNSRTPIPLPQPSEDDGGESKTATSVTGYSKEEIRQLEQWLVTNWTGGGYYEITVTDSTQPNAIVMKWGVLYDTKQHPEMVPPPLADQLAGTPVQQPQIPHPQPQRAPMAPVFPNGLPQPTFFQQQQQPQGYGMPQQPAIGTQAYAAWAGELERRKVDDELRQLRERDREREREALEAKHRAEVERVRSEAATAQRAMEAKFAELQNTIAQLNKPTVTPEFEMMKQQLRAAEEKAEHERAEREAERRDQAMRDMIKAMNDESRKQMEMMQRMFETQMQTMQAMLQQTANKPDAMKDVFLLIQEQSRANAEVVKDIARQNDNAINRLQGFMMNPMQMIQLAKESQQGAEMATERMASTFGRVIEMQQRVTENALNMQPQGGGVLDVVREGMGGLKDFAERVVSAKNANEKFAMQAQAQVAQAQARAYEAQVAAEAAAHAAANGQTVHTPPAPRPQSQLAGIPMGPVVSKKPEEQQDAGPKRLGKTDEEWFTGAFVDNVIELREAIDDNDGEDDDVTPKDVVGYVTTAVQMSMQQQVMIPAIMELLMQQRYADFVDVLIPDASFEFRTEVVQGIINMLREMSGQEPAPVPRTETKVEAKPVEAKPKMQIVKDDEDDDDEDPDQDGKPVPPPPPSSNGKKGRPARA